MTTPTISVKVNGVWTSIQTLPEQEQERIRGRIASVLQQTILRQIELMSGEEQEHKAQGANAVD